MVDDFERRFPRVDPLQPERSCGGYMLVTGLGAIFLMLFVLILFVERVCGCEPNYITGAFLICLGVTTITAGIGQPDATVVVTGCRTSASDAAFANGTLGHAMDYDDIGGFAHDATVLFTAFARPGGEASFLRQGPDQAYVVGFEVGHALSRGYGQGPHFHKMAVFGRMGAAAACAKLLKLDALQTCMALGTAGSMASGVRHNFGTMTKPLHGGLAARDGVMEAELAARGWTAGELILEHLPGFKEQFCGENVNVHDLAWVSPFGSRTSSL